MRHKISFAFIMSSISLALVGTAGTARASDTTFQSHDMMSFSTGAMLPGAGTLVRSENELWAKIDTTRLEKNAAHTVWWVIFNNPSACVDMCDVPDLSIPEARASLVYAGSIITGADRTGQASAHLVGGEISTGAPVPMGNGLEEYNGFGAAVTIVVRTHGKLLMGRVAEQIGSFDGGCDVNNCSNTQMVGFPPIMD
ncbi:MAG: hypothetical protein NW204_00205 [Xanthomonadaceae bacterium]|nr:hypothetical protein [Xanthomonadaceae bacterium]